MACARAPVRPETSVACPTLPQPVLVTVEGAKLNELHEQFDLPDTPALWAAAPEDATAARYRIGVVAHLGPDIAPKTLLTRQIVVFTAGPQAREAQNGAAVLEGRVGTIVTPSCIDRLLFARQAARYPMLEHPTEFGAFVLRGNGRVRMYVSSMDLVGQKIRHEVTDRVRDDASHGFAVVAHLHNHPFLFDRHIGDRMWTTPDTLGDVSGALAPSLTDAEFFANTAAEIPLEGAWITTGLASIRILAADFPRLATHSGEAK